MAPPLTTTSNLAGYAVRLDSGEVVETSWGHVWGEPIHKAFLEKLVKVLAVGLGQVTAFRIWDTSGLFIFSLGLILVQHFIQEIRAGAKESMAWRWVEGRYGPGGSMAGGGGPGGARPKAKGKGKKGRGKGN